MWMMLKFMSVDLGCSIFVRRCAGVFRGKLRSYTINCCMQSNPPRDHSQHLDHVHTVELSRHLLTNNKKDVNQTIVCLAICIERDLCTFQHASCSLCFSHQTSTSLLLVRPKTGRVRYSSATNAQRGMVPEAWRSRSTVAAVQIRAFSAFMPSHQAYNASK